MFHRAKLASQRVVKRLSRMLSRWPQHVERYCSCMPGERLGSGAGRACMCLTQLHTYAWQHPNRGNMSMCCQQSCESGVSGASVVVSANLLCNMQPTWHQAALLGTILALLWPWPCMSVWARDHMGQLWIHYIIHADNDIVCPLHTPTAPTPSPSGSSTTIMLICACFSCCARSIPCLHAAQNKLDHIDRSCDPQHRPQRQRMSNC